MAYHLQISLPNLVPHPSVEVVEDEKLKMRYLHFRRYLLLHPHLEQVAVLIHHSEQAVLLLMVQYYYLQLSLSH